MKEPLVSYAVVLVSFLKKLLLLLNVKSVFVYTVFHHMKGSYRLSSNFKVLQTRLIKLWTIS